MIPKIITTDYLTSSQESQYFDRKSARIKPSEVARHLVAFSNANGGVLAIGIEDDGKITSFDYKSAYTINDFLRVPFQSCQGNLKITHEIRDININDKIYTVLLFFVEPSYNSICKTSDNKVYLRVGDKSINLNHEQVIALEYDRGERNFEDIVVKDSSITDINQNILGLYKETLKTTLTCEEILEARGLIKDGHLTYAGILLFAKYPTKFLPSARVRLIKYDGVKMETGSRLNIIKEITFEDCIPAIIQKIRETINLQLREFQFLDSSGTFQIIPEYPEFAWFEGIVNSLTHRDYSLKGDHIRISLYDDRIEIFSPGKLPNIVTIDNMINTRYSRNPRIARVLSELGWVKELNEGVKRIYDEMQSLFLKSPNYTEPNNNSVLLTLENSITSRQLRNSDNVLNSYDSDILDNLNEYEFKIIQYLMNNNKINVRLVSDILSKSVNFSRKQLQNLLQKQLIEWHGSSTNDPHQYYSLNK